MRAITVNKKATNESLLLNHHIYDSISISKYKKIKVSPAGILGDEGVHIDWEIIENLLKKYKKP